MIRTAGLLLAATAVTASMIVACAKHNDTTPASTTVIQKPSGECIGYDTCPTGDQYITAVLQPKTITKTTEVPSTTLSPTSTLVPTMTPSPTSTDMPTTTVITTTP